MTNIDTNVAGRSYRYEIGNKRKDGKFNIWTHKVVREGAPDQVIVHVAASWRAARDWIVDTERKIAA